MWYLRLCCAAGAWLLAGAVPSLLAQSVVDATTLSNKFVVGYQGWHACASDGNALNQYIHWSHLNGVQPSPSDVVCDIWPDLSEFSANELFATGFTLSNGQPAKEVDRKQPAIDNQQIDSGRQDNEGAGRPAHYGQGVGQATPD